MTEEMKGLRLILNQSILVSFVNRGSFANNKHTVNHTSVFLLILFLSKHIHSMELIIELSKEIAFNWFILKEKSYLLMHSRLSLLMSFVAIVQKKQNISWNVTFKKKKSNELYNHAITYLTKLNDIDQIIY